MPRAKTKKSTEVTEEPTTETKVKAERHPNPDGWVSAADLALYVRHFGLVDVSEAQIFNITRNAFDIPKEDKDGNPIIDPETGQQAVKPANGFPAKVHTDNRTIINRDEAVEWLKQYKANQLQRRAANAQSAKGKARAAKLAVARYVINSAKLAQTNRELQLVNSQAES